VAFRWLLLSWERLGYQSHENAVLVLVLQETIASSCSPRESSMPEKSSWPRSWKWSADEGCEAVQRSVMGGLAEGSAAGCCGGASAQSIALLPCHSLFSDEG